MQLMPAAAAAAAAAPAAAPPPGCHCCFFIGVGFAPERLAPPPAARSAPTDAPDGTSLDLRDAAEEFVDLVAGWEQMPRLCPSGQVPAALVRGSVSARR